MFAKTLFAATLAIAAAGFATASAQAAEVDYDYPVALTSSVSRVVVLAQAQQARAAGLIAQGELSVAAPSQGTGLTRAQVRAELAEAIRVGGFEHNERSKSPTQAQLDSIRMAGLRALAMTMASL